jgi:hypothetical protein
VSVATITFCVASQVFIVVCFVIDSVQRLLDTSLYGYYNCVNTDLFVQEIHSVANSTDTELHSTGGPMFHPRGPPGPMGMRGPGPRPGELLLPCTVK